MEVLQSPAAASAVAKRDVKKLEVETIEAIKISSEDQLKNAGLLLSKVKTRAKEIKKTKDVLMAPHKKEMDAIKESFKPSEETLKKLEDDLKEAMLEYNNKIEAEAQKQAEYIERRLNKGTMKIETGIAKLASIDQAHTSTEGAQFRKGKEQVRITDIEALLRSAPAYFTRDRVLEALRMEITADWKDGKELPEGVEIYRKKIVAGIAS